MRKRIFFNKTDQMKYISHLDMVRFFERVFNKSNIKVKYSEGYHPRPKMSFGNPVSLGVEAYNEIMDLDLAEEYNDEELLKILNENTPQGFFFHGIEEVAKKSNINTEFETILYMIDGTKEEIEKLRKLFEQESIVEERIKRGKKQIRDLKSKIRSIEILETKINLQLENISPKAFFVLAESNMNKLNIKRLGYR